MNEPQVLTNQKLHSKELLTLFIHLHSACMHSTPLPFHTPSIYPTPPSHRTAQPKIMKITSSLINLLSKIGGATGTVASFPAPPRCLCAGELGNKATGGSIPAAHTGTQANDKNEWSHIVSNGQRRLEASNFVVSASSINPYDQLMQCLDKGFKIILTQQTHTHTCTHTHEYNMMSIVL